MEQSPYDTNSHSARQEILRLLLNPKFHYRVHKSSPLAPILSQMNPVHTFPPYLIHSNINLPSMPMFSKWSLLFRLSNQNFIRISNLSHAYYMPHPSLSSSFRHSNNNFVEYTSYEALHYALFSSLPPVSTS